MFQSLLLCAMVVGQAPTAPMAPMTMEAPPAASPSATTTNPLMPQPATNPYVVLDQGQSVFSTSPAAEPKRTNTIVGSPYPLSSAPSENKFSGSVVLNQDTFFGFYPVLNGSYAITDSMALTFYGLFWTNPGFTPNGQGGTGLWTEFAAGVSFSILDGALSINPAIGFLNGRLLSGATRAIPFEGIVLQTSASHAGKYTEGQAFVAYYTATAAPSNNAFLHWWATGGVRPFADSNDWLQIFSVGAHFEQLFQTKNRTGTTGNIYTWVGPYLQMTLPNNIFMRVSAGWDTQDRVSGNFYKASMGITF